MDGEQTTGAQVVPMPTQRERLTKTSTPIVPEQCRDCRKRIEKLTRFIYMAADIADEFDH